MSPSCRYRCRAGRARQRSPRRRKSAPTFRALADKGLLRKDFLNGEAGGGGVYYWTSREAAEAWYTPAWRAKAKETFGAEPIITYYETYVTVDNIKGETIVREHD